MLKKIVLAILLLVVAGLGLLRYSHLPDPLAADSESAQWLSTGIHDVTFFDVELVDETRATQANGDYPGEARRTLQTRIWYPKGTIVSAPLVIYSHGFMSKRYGGSYLAEHLASHGYIVAAMDYPLTHFFAPGGPLVKDVVNQPADISFLLDQFLSWNQEAGHQFYNAIDAHRIGVVGLSLGGMTSTLVAFHPAFGDPRIAAAVSIAGPTFPFAESFFQFHSVPFLMIASPLDPMVTYAENARDIPKRVPGSVLVSLENASHTGFDATATLLRWMKNPDTLGCRQVNEGLEKSAGQNWIRELGTEAQGVRDLGQPVLCAQEVLPPAMNPIRQHWLTTIAVHSFFESRFSLDESERLAARQFLLHTMAQEQADVSVAVAAP